MCRLASIPVVVETIPLSSAQSLSDQPQQRPCLIYTSHDIILDLTFSTPQPPNHHSHTHLPFLDQASKAQTSTPSPIYLSQNHLSSPHPPLAKPSLIPTPTNNAHLLPTPPLPPLPPLPAQPRRRSPQRLHLRYHNHRANDLADRSARSRPRRKTSHRW